MQYSVVLFSIQDLFELLGKSIDSRILRQEPDSGAVQQIGIRCFPDLRGEVDMDKKRSMGVVRLNADPEMALVETASAVPEAAFDRRRILLMSAGRIEG